MRMDAPVNKAETRGNISTQQNADALLLNNPAGGKMRHISTGGVRKHKAVERPFVCSDGGASWVGVGGCCNLILHYLEWQFDRVAAGAL
jgi:hypothetical protein